MPPTSGVDEIRLRDGTRVVVRPIRPADSQALIALHSRLSADSIYRRYFSARPHLSPADVNRFTHVDGKARFALVVMRGAEDGDTMVAVARYEGSVGEQSAELAVVVDDALHHQGLGRVLLGRLVDVAHEGGLTELVADVLGGNAAMLGLLRGLDVPSRNERDAGTVTVTLDLTNLELPADRRERARRHLARAGVPLSST